MSGARRQIFMVFAAFMMVEKFGFAVHELTVLFLVNYIANIIFAPMMGALIMRIGEKWSLTFEYAGLALVFLAYFQKIANPADIAPTAAVAFTINHIAAVFLPAALGYLWVVSQSSVFVLAALLAAASLGLALIIPRYPERGHETIFRRP